MGFIICALLISHLLLFQVGQARHISIQTDPGGPYLYYVLRQPGGFVLARARMGANHQPLETPRVVASFGGSFGQSTADTVISLQLSPDGRYLAIDGAHSDAELLWIFDTLRLSLTLEPPDVSGTFLHWLPGSGETFLFRPILPLGPDAPLNGGAWNPGIWLVNATTGTYINIDIRIPSTSLVDAIASPDGSQIIYSTTPGLGMGSDIWSIDTHGQNQMHLLKLSDDAQSIAGMFTWSPDGQSIAYERLADSPTPFLPAGLWVMNRQGGNQRLLARADGGHGFPLRWSPDSKKIAFVARTNLSTSMADQSVQALQSAIEVVDVGSGQVWSVASSTQTGVQINANPVWSSNGSWITFTAFDPLNPDVGGTVRYWSVKVGPIEINPSAALLSPATTHVIAIGDQGTEK